MTIFHLVSMVLASFRLVEIVTLDRISAPIRDRFPHYFWTCGRCVSVWTGAIAVGVFMLAPWLNWPLALSWLYIAFGDWLSARGAYWATRWPKRILVSANRDGDVQIEKTTLNYKDVAEVLATLLEDLRANGSRVR